MVMNIAGMIAKYFAMSFAMENVVRAPRSDQQLLSDRDHFDKLGRIAVEIDHVAGLFRGGCTGIHRQTDIGLRQRRRIIRAITRSLPRGGRRPVLLDVLELILGCGLSQKIINSGFRRDRGCGEGIVAGDHDAANAHSPKLRDALLHSTLDDVFQVDNAQQASAIAHGERAFRQPAKYDRSCP
jgi:hypothetical protein